MESPDSYWRFFPGSLLERRGEQAAGCPSCSGPDQGSSAWSFSASWGSWDSRDSEQPFIAAHSLWASPSRPWSLASPCCWLGWSQWDGSGERLDPASKDRGLGVSWEPRRRPEWFRPRVCCHGQIQGAEEVRSLDLAIFPGPGLRAEAPRDLTILGPR